MTQYIIKKDEVNTPKVVYLVVFFYLKGIQPALDSLRKLTKVPSFTLPGLLSPALHAPLCH
jgi:hypothetical protein